MKKAEIVPGGANLLFPGTNMAEIVPDQGEKAE